MEEFEVEAYVSKHDAQRLMLLELITHIVILDQRNSTLDQQVVLAFYTGDCQDPTVRGISEMLHRPVRSVQESVNRLVKRGLLAKVGVQVRGIPQKALRAHLTHLQAPRHPIPVTK